jgi:hypothetical protein
MDALRTSLAAAERLVRKSAKPQHEADERGGASSAFKVGAAIVLTVLAATNLVTWRALDRERARRVAAERSHEQPDRSAPFVLGPSSQMLLQAKKGALEVQHASSPVSVAAPTEAAGTTAVVSLNSARLAKRLADPAARDALREQMKGPALQLYGELLKRWHLSGAAAGPVLDALADYQSRQLVVALAPGSAAGYQTSETNVADNDAVRAALTAKQLDDLRNYDESLQDRQTIAPLLSELEIAQTPLSKDTAEQLVGMMHDERVAVPSPIARPGAQAPTVQAMGQWQSDLNQRILDRAEFILPSAALTRLQAIQNAQRAAASVFASTIPENATTAGDGTPNMN